MSIANREQLSITRTHSRRLPARQANPCMTDPIGEQRAVDLTSLHHKHSVFIGCIPLNYRRVDLSEKSIYICTIDTSSPSHMMPQNRFVCFLYRKRLASWPIAHLFRDHCHLHGFPLSVKVSRSSDLSTYLCESHGDANFASSCLRRRLQVAKDSKPCARQLLATDRQSHSNIGAWSL